MFMYIQSNRIVVLLMWSRVGVFFFSKNKIKRTEQNGKHNRQNQTRNWKVRTPYTIEASRGGGGVCYISTYNTAHFRLHGSVSLARCRIFTGHMRIFSRHCHFQKRCEVYASRSNKCSFSGHETGDRQVWFRQRSKIKPFQLKFFTRQYCLIFTWNVECE